jgi:hypothetical protein
MAAGPMAKVPIAAGSIDAYNTPFFSSRDELRSWYESQPAKLNALLNKLGVDTAAPSKTEWMKAQMLAIDRTHPNG